MAGKPAEDLPGGFGITGNHQMPDDNPLGAIGRGAVLHHFFNGRRSVFRIIRGVKKIFGDGSVQCFEIREIHIHGILQQGQRFGAFVGGRIPEHRQMEALFTGRGHALYDGRHGMTPGNYVDVFRPLFLEGEAYGGKFGGIHQTAHAAPGNLVILTKNAAQITAADKDRAGAAFPGDRRFLPPVYGCGGDAEPGIFTAEAFFSRLAVNAAAAGAEETLCHIVIPILRVYPIHGAAAIGILPYFIMERKRIYITVKTYPTLSEKYDELVCTAGIGEKFNGLPGLLSPHTYRSVSPMGMSRKIYQQGRPKAALFFAPPRGFALRPSASCLGPPGRLQPLSAPSMAPFPRLRSARLPVRTRSTGQKIKPP
ncbi:hypothetical protein AGMMS49928_03200 [Spirochaetia bacterium]|nr:hypothetical protein AGMMS49928_03200 [Spirochaetia bacterium]